MWLEDLDKPTSCMALDNIQSPPTQVRGDQRAGSVSDVDMRTPMPLIYKALFSSISTFETPPGVDMKDESHNDGAFS